MFRATLSESELSLVRCRNNGLAWHEEYEYANSVVAIKAFYYRGGAPHLLTVYDVNNTERWHGSYRRDRSLYYEVFYNEDGTARES